MKQHEDDNESILEDNMTVKDIEEVLELETKTGLVSGITLTTQGQICIC